MRLFQIVTAFLLLAVGSGCVERTMVITSEPSGATVTINHVYRGTTPYTMKFLHYGDYNIRVEKEGYYPTIVSEPIKAPGYQKFPLELPSEVLLPKRLSDNHELHYVLKEITAEDDAETVLRNAKEAQDMFAKIVAESKARDAKHKPFNAPLPLKHPEKKKKEKPAEPAKEADAPKAEPTPVEAAEISTPSDDAPAP